MCRGRNTYDVKVEMCAFQMSWTVAGARFVDQLTGVGTYALWGYN